MDLGNIAFANTQYEFDNTGFYAQGTFKITPRLALTGGFRYSIDEIRGIQAYSRLHFDENGFVNQTCNNPIAFPEDPNAAIPSGRVVDSVWECTERVTVKSEAPTWLINLDFKPTEDLLLYTKWARGYRQGGMNLTNVGLPTWEPEKVDAYEVGAKTTFSGVVDGYFNIAGFYNDLSDAQTFAALIALPTSGFPGGAGILNAGKARSYGIEVEAAATFFDSLRFDVGYSYIDSKIQKIDVPTPADLGLQDLYAMFFPLSLEGDPFTFTPKHRITVTGTYTLPLPVEYGELSVGATYTYTDKQLINRSSENFQTVPSSNLLNLNLTWDRVMDGPFSLAAFATNITNEIVPTNVVGSYSSQGYEGLQYAPPRMYGLRLKYSFGAGY